jgi:alpha-1,6-mannosyltransferase
VRIVDLNEFYSPTGGGVRTYLDRKMGIMADMGHELIVIAPALKSSIEERPGGGKIYWLKCPPLIFDRNYGIFVHDIPVWALLDELKPDVVECSSTWLPAWTVAKWQGGDAVKVFFAHGDQIGAYPQRWLDAVASPVQVERAFDFYTQYMNSFLVEYDAFVTNGPALAKRFRRRGQTVHASMALGIERQWFSPDQRDEQLRVSLLEQLGLPPEGHLLLGLGRHHKEKRWPLVIDAVEAAGADLPVGLVLIGDGPQRRALENRIAGSPHIKIFRPVYDRVRFTRIMASCDALIHGSDAEPFGLVALEALASGLPLIGPDEGGFAEIADPLFAETYAARDAQSAAEAVRRLVRRDQPILRAAARVAAGKVRSDVDHAAELLDYYAGLVEAKRGGGATLRAAGNS